MPRRAESPPRRFVNCEKNNILKLFKKVIDFYFLCSIIELQINIGAKLKCHTYRK